MRETVKALRIILYQPHAHYRLPFTHHRRHSYPIPPYSTVRGFLCNVLNIRGHTLGEDPERNQDFQKLKAVKMGIAGQFEAKTTEYLWFRNLSKEEHVKRFGSVENRKMWGIGEHPGGQAPVLVDVLNEVRVVVYLVHEDSAFLEHIYNSLKNPCKRLYPLYLGRSEDWVVIEDVSREVVLEFKTRDADFGHFFWIPEKLYLPPGKNFDFNRVEGIFYRVPFFWELREGNRNFQYVLAKLSDGRFKNISFLFDSSFGEKGLPVFLLDPNISGEATTSVVLAKSNRVRLRNHVQDLNLVFENLRKKLCKSPFWLEVEQVLRYAILCHDFGKVLPSFQIKVLGNEEYQPFDIHFNLPHSLASLFFVDSDFLEREVGKEKAGFLLTAVAFHHFRENFFEYLVARDDEMIAFCKKLLQDESWREKLLQNLKEEMKGTAGFEGYPRVLGFNRGLAEALVNGLILLDFIFLPYRIEGLPARLRFSENRERFFVLLSGFLQRCDHFASFCEEEGEFFAPEEEGLSGEELWDKLLSSLRKKAGVNKLWQEEMLEGRCGQNLILVAPTGYGKTEFAFLWSKGEKFFYTLPLRAAVNQMYWRGKALWGEKLGLLHSDADLVFLEEASKKENVEYQDNYNSYQLSRQLAFPACVSTGDQFFPYALHPPGYEKIYATFSYAGLVIDEVQAYSPEAAAIIVKFAEDLTKMGGKFLLMTATLPEFVKREIMQRTGISEASFVNLYDTKRGKFESIKKHRIKTFNVENLSSLAEKVLEQAKLNDGQRVLVVVNTVSRAQELYEELRSLVDQNVELLLLHSRFTVWDRQRLEAQIQRSFKNPKKSPDGAKILVATQVVEASLDIDADVLFTELAPLDALVQRMGRALRRIGPQFDGLGSGLYRAPNGEEYRIATDTPNVYLFYLEDTVKRSPYSAELLLNSIFIFNGLLEGKNEEEIQKEIVSFMNKKGKKSLELKEGEFLLSEYDKYRLVCFFYRVMEEAGTEYIRAFFNTLSILDAGYVSSRKSEAQRIFRKIADVSAVPEILMDSFCRDVVNFVSGNCEEKKSFTHFKRDVLSKYVVSVPWTVAKGAVMRGEGVFSKLFNMLPASEQDLLSEYPLRSWLSNIFVVPGDYNDLGFVKAKTGKVDDANIL